MSFYQVWKFLGHYLFTFCFCLILLLFSWSSNYMYIICWECPTSSLCSLFSLFFLPVLQIGYFLLISFWAKCVFCASCCKTCSITSWFQILSFSDLEYPSIFLDSNFLEILYLFIHLSIFNVFVIVILKS